MNIDQAAIRAAEKIAGAVNRGAEAIGLGRYLWDTELTTLASRVIAAEFAPLQERLVEAERLLGRARKPVADWSSQAEEHNPTLADIDKFLAAKPEEVK